MKKGLTMLVAAMVITGLMCVIGSAAAVELGGGQPNCDQTRNIVEASSVGWDGSTMDCENGVLIIGIGPQESVSLSDPMTDEEAQEATNAMIASIWS